MTPPTAQTPIGPAIEIESFNQILVAMISVSDKVSDLIFSPGRPPQVELHSKLTPVKVPGFEVLQAQHTSAIAKVLIEGNSVAIESLSEKGSADLSYGVPGHGPFRVNVFRQRGSYAIVMRVFPMSIPSFDQLRLPSHLRDIAKLKTGIVLVTGPTG